MKNVSDNTINLNTISNNKMASELRIIKAIKRDIIEPIQSAKSKENKVTKFFNLYAISVTLFAALLAADTTMTDIRIREANDNIKEYTAWMRQIDQSLLNLRMHENQARMMVQNGEDIDVKKFNIERIEYQKEVANALSGVKNRVSINVDNSAVLSNKFDASVANIVSKNSPSDSAWKNYLIRNNLLFGFKIQEQNSIIIHEQKFILSRCFDNLKYWVKKILKTIFLNFNRKP